MKKFRTVISVMIMAVAGIAGLFVGGSLNDMVGGAILFSMIAGIACIIYSMDNHES